MSPEKLDQDWNLLLTMLPSDLEACARETGALVRRRQVRSAADLLHLAFAYNAWCEIAATIRAVQQRPGEAGPGRG